MAGIINKQRAPNPRQAPQNSAPAVDENNPVFIQAMKYAMQVLYGQKAANDVAEQLRSAKDKASAVSDIAYNITQTVDERTGGKVPRDLIGLLAMAILKEVIDIGQAAKMNITPLDAASAFKNMLLRYLGENGVDTSQLQQGMDKIDPAIFSKGA
jgi:hypothetical protein